MIQWLILEGDARAVLAEMPAASVQTCITSPPYYGLRDYGHAGQIGLESSIDAYVAALVDVFRAVRRVLRPDGTLWLNIGDSFGGLRGNITPAPDNKHRFAAADTPGKGKAGTDRKQLLLMPARVALALQADGWILRAEIIWHKLNPMPESVKDRPTKAHEQVYLFSVGRRYYYDAAAIAEPAVVGANGSTFTRGKTALNGARPNVGQGPRVDRDTRNARDVWSLVSEPFPGSHFATMPTELARRCILAGSRPGDTVLDPFSGAGTTVLTALRHERRGLGIELNPTYVHLSRARIVGDAPLFNTCEVAS